MIPSIAGFARPQRRRLRGHRTGDARRLAVAAAFALAACGAGGAGEQASPETAPTTPLPTAGISGARVAVYPVTLLAADEGLGWQSHLADRRAALDHADSIIGALLVERSPEVEWVLPSALRRAARQAPGMLADPDRMATALLRASELKQIPDPLRSQMRSLNGVAGDRYALVPAALLFRPDSAGRGRAELTLVLADVRTGLLGWRTVARGSGSDPWEALRVAFKTLTPGLP